jgi:hypothetical protein
MEEYTMVKHIIVGHLLLASFLILCTAVTSHAIELPDLLPIDNEIQGWVRDGDYQYPQTEDSLRSIINGAADLFLRHDFRGAVFQDYIDTSQMKLSIQIFDQTSPAQAKAIYDSTALGDETPVQGLGEEAREVELLFTYQIAFWRNWYYVSGIVESKESSYKQALVDFMMLVDEKIITPAVQRTSWGSIKATCR